MCCFLHLTAAATGIDMRRKLRLLSDYIFKTYPLLIRGPQSHIYHKRNSMAKTNHQVRYHHPPYAHLVRGILFMQQYEQSVYTYLLSYLLHLALPISRQVSYDSKTDRRICKYQKPVTYFLHSRFLYPEASQEISPHETIADTCKDRWSISVT